MNHDHDSARATPLLFPLWLPQNPLRRKLKVALGHMALLARPGLAHRLQNGATPSSVIERVALAGLIDRHRRAGTLESLAHLHRNFWAGNQAKDFYSATQDRFERVFLGEHQAVVRQMVEIMASGDFHTLCEVGCGDGQVLAHLRDALPGLRHLIGLDLNVAQTGINRERYAGHPDMEFVAADATEWIPSRIGPGWIVFAYGGVFEYLPQTRFAELLRVVAANAPACIGFVEPVAEGQDLAADGPSLAYGTELSYSHPYLHLMEKAGLGIVWRQETRFGDSGPEAMMAIART